MSDYTTTMIEVNGADEGTFVNLLGDVYEVSPGLPSGRGKPPIRLD